MPCTPINLLGGAGFYCSRHLRRLCRFCHQDVATKLCDFPISPSGKTCDADMCGKCATNVGPDQDYCPDHKHQAPPQLQLFSE